MGWSMWSTAAAVVIGATVIAARRPGDGPLRDAPTGGYAMALVAALLLLLGSLYGLVLEVGDDGNCRVQAGSSAEGEFGWSAVPPGHTCTFTEERHGFNEVRGPGPGMSLWLVAVTGAATSASWLIRRRPGGHRGSA